MKKKLTEKKESNDLKTEIRHLGVIIEHINSKLTTEILKYHADALNSHTEMIEKLKTDKVDVEEFAALERRVAFRK